MLSNNYPVCSWKNVVMHLIMQYFKDVILSKKRPEGI
jgi:hypothetical protein